MLLLIDNIYSHFYDNEVVQNDIEKDKVRQVSFDSNIAREENIF